MRSPQSLTACLRPVFCCAMLILLLAACAGIPPDQDGDTVPDSEECADIGAGNCPDSDGDGTPDYLDPDDDNDDVPTRYEAVGDSDGDGIIDRLDTDDDGDELPTEFEGSNDNDQDGIPNWLDLDSDGDGISDDDEGSNDSDQDGIPNFVDLDSDNDGMPDAAELLFDSDGDGTPDFVDFEINQGGLLFEGTACLRNNQCISNDCADGTCTCLNKFIGCPSGSYCDTGTLGFGRNRCKLKKGTGAICTASKQCQSNICVQTTQGICL